MRVVAIKLRALGDTVIWSAALTRLHELLDRRASGEVSTLEVVAPRAWASALEGLPGMDRLTLLSGGRAELLRAALRWRRERVALVLAFHASPRTAWAARLSGARERGVHFHGHRDANQFSTFEVPGKGTLSHAIDRDHQLLRGLARTWGLPDPPLGSTRFVLSEAERAWGRRWLEERGLRAPVLALGVGASRPTKLWPLEHYAELAHAWVSTRQGGVLGVRSSQDLFGPALWPNGAKPIAWTEGLSVRQLASVLSGVAQMVGSDSGPRHIAAALGVPTVTLFGPESPAEWHPYDRAKHPYFFVEGLTCRRDAEPGFPPWCALTTCVTERHRCMTTLTAQEVIQTCLTPR